MQGRERAGGRLLDAGTLVGHLVPGKPRVDWDDPQAKDALVSALVNDANALVAALKDRELGEQAASAVGLLALVAGDRVISTVDPEARHTRKSPENRRDGYRAHVAACPETGIITGEGLTRAAGEENSDAAVG